MSLTLAICSDLHVENSNCTLAAPGADLLIVAGDVLEARSMREPTAVSWLRERAPEGIPTIFVPGNHDLTHRRFSDAIACFHREAEGTSIHPLVRGRMDIKGIRFLGTPLFSGFDLYGDRRREAVMARVEETIADFRYCLDDAGLPWTTQWMRARHEEEVAWLASELDLDPSVPKVVITHWAPTRGSVHPRFLGDILAPYWVNDYPELVARARLWVHGHTHDEFDYTVPGAAPGFGRVLCHPRGISKFFNVAQNNAYQGPRLVKLR